MLYPFFIPCPNREEINLDYLVNNLSKEGIEEILLRHPEWTTTIQDGEITWDKFHETLKDYLVAEHSNSSYKVHCEEVRSAQESDRMYQGMCLVQDGADKFIYQAWHNADRSVCGVKKTRLSDMIVFWDKVISLSGHMNHLFATNDGHILLTMGGDDRYTYVWDKDFTSYTTIDRGTGLTTCSLAYTRKRLGYQEVIATFSDERSCAMGLVIDNKVRWYNVEPFQGIQIISGGNRNGMHYTENDTELKPYLVTSWKKDKANAVYCVNGNTIYREIFVDVNKEIEDISRISGDVYTYFHTLDGSIYRFDSSGILNDDITINNITNNINSTKDNIYYPFNRQTKIGTNGRSVLYEFDTIHLTSELGSIYGIVQGLVCGRRQTSLYLQRGGITFDTVATINNIPYVIGVTYQYTGNGHYKLQYIREVNLFTKAITYYDGTDDSVLNNLKGNYDIYAITFFNGARDSLQID